MTTRPSRALPGGTRRRATAAALAILAARAACTATPRLTAPDAPIVLPDRQFFPEGITANHDGGLYVGSQMQGSILHLAPGSRAPKTFAASGARGLATVVGVHAAKDNKTLYACSSDPGFGKLTGTAKPAVVAFAIPSGAAAGRIELPGGGPATT